MGAAHVRCSVKSSVQTVPVIILQSVGLLNIKQRHYYYHY